VNKKILIGLLIGGVIIAGGAGGYFLSQNNDNTSGNTNTSTNESSQSKSGEPEFRPVATEGQSFVATLSGQSDGETINGTIEYDKNGNSKFRTTTSEGELEFYVIGEDTYSCTNGQCFKFSGSTDQNPLDLDDLNYNYSEDDVASFEDSARYLGQQPCPAGSCNVWRVTEGDYETDTYISTKDNRISQLLSRGENTEITIIYEYKDVVVTPPTNVQTLPGF
jgi:hypothetical protein